MMNINKIATFLLTLMTVNLYAQEETIIPRYFPSFWNGSVARSENVLDDNNCYNYATNRVTNTFAQPGLTAGKRIQELTCESVKEAALLDPGIEETEFFPLENNNEFTLIALVVNPKNDFHWYRRDANGQWSHKPGSTPVTNRDGSNRRIMDPEKADRNNYTDFCGYFKIKNLKVYEHTQNGGQVDIGVVLPAKKKSRIINHKTFGIRNQTQDMHDLIQNQKVLATLQSLNKLIQTSSEPVVDQQLSQEPSILIEDEEGLVFDSNFTIQILAESILVYDQKSQKITKITSEKFMTPLVTIFEQK